MIGEALDLGEHRLRILRDAVRELERRATFIGPDGFCFCAVRTWLRDEPHTEDCLRIRRILQEAQDA